ncbi:MAG: hydroxyacylglutathione hydrolase [Chlamydiales bacterium]
MRGQLKVIPALTDNYIYELTGQQGSLLVDPGEQIPAPEKLLAILLTHHHSDHTAAAASYNVPIIGPDKPPEEFTLGDFSIKTIATPGHTRDHKCYYLPEEKLLFSGDTLFAAGCGRLFECDAATLYNSLQKLKKLPDETRICCGHNYLKKNLKFALSLEPENPAIQKRLQNLTPEEPPILKLEKETNPFLRAKNVEEFATIRKKRDQL